MKLTGPFNRIFVGADNHFGHENIIEFCDRPFADVEEMDAAMIDSWNGVVEPNDIVIHLADFTLGNMLQAHSYLKQLNGRIHMLCYTWHHDKRWLPHRDVIIMSKKHCVTWLDPLVVLEIKEWGQDGRPLAISLCHYPLAVWDRKHYGAWHCFGHCHGKHEGGENSIDVGVDNAYRLTGQYRPLSLAEIKEALLQ